MQYKKYRIKFKFGGMDFNHTVEAQNEAHAIDMLFSAVRDVLNESVVIEEESE